MYIVTGDSERILKVFRDYNIRMVFKSGPTLCSLLTKVKDLLPMTKQSNVITKCHAPVARCT